MDTDVIAIQLDIGAKIVILVRNEKLYNYD